MLYSAFARNFSFSIFHCTLKVDMPCIRDKSAKDLNSKYNSSLMYVDVVYACCVFLSASSTSTPSYVTSLSTKPATEKTMSLQMLKHMEREKKQLSQTEFFLVSVVNLK